MEDLLALVDRTVEGRVVVFGAPPPEGRDLDVLARPDEERRLHTALADAGFRRAGRRHVRFRDCTADVVELVPAADWNLSPGQLDELFAQATPLDGSRNLTLPAAHHRLLIAARKLAWDGGALDDRRSARVRDALATGSALEDARRLAPAWSATRALEALEAAARDGGRAPRKDVLLGVAEQSRGGARWVSAARRALPGRRPRRGALVTFSGLDGSGKSSQARALKDTLDRLGYDAVVEWSSLSQHPRALHLITGAVARILGRRAGGSSEGSEVTSALRERSPLVTFAWSVLVALTNGLSHARAVNRHLWRGRVVVCDRYTLDSRVHLRYAYGERRRFRVQTWLIRLLSPTPDRSYFLDVSAETATGRKADYPLEENARRARLYREEASRFATVTLDGERPPAETCKRVAEDVTALLDR